MALKIDINHKEADLLWDISLTGSLDTETAPELEEDLAKVFDSDCNKVVFNMTGLDYVNSAGIRIIALTSKKMEEKSGAIAMIGLQPQIEKVFDIVKALPNFSIFKDDAEADEYFDHIQKTVLDGD